MANSYLLKIITGPNQGAEAVLSDETVLIGSSDDCDIIIADTLVSPQHLTLTIAGDSIILTPGEAPVYVDGEKLSPQVETPIKPFQFVGLATTYFVIGPSEGTWPAISASDIPVIKKTEAPKPKSESALPEENTEENTEQTELPGQADLNDSAPEEKPKSGFFQTLYNQQPWAVFALSGAIVVLVAFSVFNWLTQEITAETVTINEHQVQKDRIQNLFHSYGLDKDYTLTDNGNQLFLEAWVKNLETKNEIENALLAINPRISMQIWNHELLLDNVQELLEIWKIRVVADSLDEPGKILLKGYYGDPQRWEATKDRLERDIPGIKLLKDEVLNSQNVLLLGNPILKEYGLDSRLQIVPYQDQVALKGIVSENITEIVQKAIQDLRNAFGGNVGITSQVLYAKPETLYSNLDIDSVSIGQQGVIITRDGQRYFEGSILPSGFLIEKIARDGILLKKGDQTITIKIGENYE